MFEKDSIHVWKRFYTRLETTTYKNSGPAELRPGGTMFEVGG